MGTKRKIAEWHMKGKLFVVRPPDWPKNTEVTFTKQGQMIAYAQAAGLILKERVKRERVGW